MAEKTTLIVDLDGNPTGYIKAIDEAESKTTGFESSLSDLASKSAIAFAALSGAIGYSVKQFSDAQSVQAKLNATLESTKFAAGLTATELSNMATQLSRVSTYDDEAILGAENLLLKFTNIGKDVFPKAIQASADLAEKFGGIDAAALAVGKALARPTEGLGALSRAGINFTDSEIKVMQSLIDTGKAAEAQDLILKRIAETSAGQAAAAANTLAGQLAGMRTEFNNVTEAIGAVFAPVLQQAATSLKNLFIDLQKNPALLEFGANLLGVSAAVTGSFAGIGGAILGVQKILPIFNIAITGTTTTLRGLAGATGIGLVIIAITELVTHWSEVQAATSAAAFAIFATVQSLAQSVYNAFASIGAALKSALSGEFEDASTQASAALSSITGIFSKAGQDASAAYAEGKLVGKQILDNANKQIQKSEVDTQAETDHLVAVQRQAAYDKLIADQQAELQAAQDKKDGLVATESAMADEITSIYDLLGENELNSYEGATDDLLSAAQDRASQLSGIESSLDSGGSSGGTSGGGLGGGGLGILGSDSPEGRAARAALRSNPQAYANYRPGVSPTDLLKAVNQAVAAGGFQFKQGYSGEGFLGTFGGREVVIPKRFADGIKAGDYALTGGNRPGRNGSQTVRVDVGFNGREASRVLTARQNQDRAVGTSREI